jgi:hypothetical protein
LGTFKNRFYYRINMPQEKYFTGQLRSPWLIRRKKALSRESWGRIGTGKARLNSLIPTFSRREKEQMSRQRFYDAQAKQGQGIHVKRFGRDNMSRPPAVVLKMLQAKVGFQQFSL